MEQNQSQWPPRESPRVPFPTGKRELLFGVPAVVFSLVVCNGIYAGGYNLAFGLGAMALILCAGIYLWSAGCRPSAYSAALLGFSLVISAGFAWSADGFVKFVMFGFLVFSAGLGLCLMAGQNRRDPGSACSVWDVPRTLFRLGFGKLPEAFGGLSQAVRADGAGRKSGAFALGLCLAIPVLAVLLPLLTGADAAFEGLISRLPEFEVEELLFSTVWGIGLGCVFYTQAVALKHSPAREPAIGKQGRLSPITVNTLLGSVCFVYLVYLLSQLAYFAGGFSGLLPEGYTLAQYARRGFFEMTALCAVNLAVMVASLGLVRKAPRAPRSTRCLCVAIGLVTLFLVCTASAKMFLYIGSYGMSRLRLLTQIIMLFLGLTTLVVSVWLFVPRLPYMKIVVLCALVIGSATLWLDVDSVVARYNVDAYLAGRMETVDVHYLEHLGDGALLQLERLAKLAPEASVARRAQSALRCRYSAEDLRGWNYFNGTAQKWKK